MTSNFVENEEKELSELNAKKKSLRVILASCMKKKHLDQKGLERMKKEFSDIKNDMKEVKTGYEALMNIHKKLSKAYNQLNEKEE